jgi:hypothetical protein
MVASAGTNALNRSFELQPWFREQFASQTDPDD